MYIYTRMKIKQFQTTMKFVSNNTCSGQDRWYYTDRLQLPNSYKIFFQACKFMELLGDGAVKVVTVRNCYINSACFFDGLVKYIFVQSTVMDIILVTTDLSL